MASETTCRFTCRCFIIDILEMFIIEILGGSYDQPEKNTGCRR